MSFFSFGKSKNKLGIDIGTSSIKIIELSKDGGRFKLENYGLFELQAHDEKTNGTGSDAVARTRIAQLSENDYSWGIKETLKITKIKAQDAIASIPTFSTFSTVISMPYLSEKDIAQSIPFEARKYIPLPLSDVVLDWSIINVSQNQQPIIEQKQGYGAKPPTVEVFLAAVPKEETLRYQSIVKNAGLSLRALELENSALIRALIGNDVSPVAIVNIGGRSTSILIVDKGFERINHNYEVGGFEITKSIARTLGVDIKRAEEMKRNFGIKDSDSNVIRQAMSSLIDMMAFEAKKTIHNYEEQKGVKISNVMLIGGMANMLNFANYFGEKLGMPVSLGNSFARIVVPKELEGLKGELNSTFAVAAGLAMREI